jgi:hypothetical protein
VPASSITNSAIRTRGHFHFREKVIQPIAIVSYVSDCSVCREGGCGAKPNAGWLRESFLVSQCRQRIRRKVEVGDY